MHEVERFHKQAGSHHPLFGITGCMVRKTGVSRSILTNEMTNKEKERLKRSSATQITLLDSIDGLWNYDDELFLRSPLIDFVFRIEEVAFLTKLLSVIS